MNIHGAMPLFVPKETVFITVFPQNRINGTDGIFKVFVCHTDDNV